MVGMTSIVKTITRIMSGVVFLFGLYIVTHGHITPGGGFAGGTIIAGSFILLVLAYGDNIMHLRKIKEESSSLENLAIFGILIMAAAGMLLGAQVFFRNYLPLGEAGELFSAGFIPLFNILIGIEVAAALFTVFLAFVIFKEEGK
jgi:multisubunit Na+/H+ antiporter MnhB subunit